MITDSLNNSLFSPARQDCVVHNLNEIKYQTVSSVSIKVYLSPRSVVVEIHQRTCIHVLPLFGINKSPGKLSSIIYIIATPSPFKERTVYILLSSSLTGITRARG